MFGRFAHVSAHRTHLEQGPPRVIRHQAPFEEPAPAGKRTREAESHMEKARSCFIAGHWLTGCDVACHKATERAALGGSQEGKKGPNTETGRKVSFAEDFEVSRPEK